MNMMGEDIVNVHKGVVSKGTYQVDLSEQPDGIYIVKVLSDSKTFLQTIMISR